MTASYDLLPVHLLQLPVPLAARSREHFEGLMREFFLISAGADDADHVPVRLLQLVGMLTAQYGDINTAADQRFDDAVDAGDAVIEDQLLLVPPAGGPASQALGDLLDEADDYCRHGQHLLTLATPPECVAYRRWYLGQVVTQLLGEPPVAWPDSVEAQGT